MSLTVLVAQKFDDLPDLVGLQLIAKRRHDGAAASPGDGVENHRIGRFVNPFVVGEIGANRAFGFVAVTGIAPGFQEQPLAFNSGGRVVRKRILQFLLGARGTEYD